MNTQKKTTRREEFRTESSDRGAVVHTTSDLVEVCFGRWEGGDFVPRAFHSSRFYATAGRAMRAVTKWLAEVSA
jgi:hypothetical protein